MTPPLSPTLPVAVVGPLYAGSMRGLASDLLAAHALTLDGHAVCTAIVAASHGRVSDVVEVPEDTVRAQLEHLAATVAPEAYIIGALLTPKTADAVFGVLPPDVPVVLDLVASGPSGETLLERRGIEAVADRMGRATLVTASRQDAELATGGEIRSLDDAQVAAQRMVKRGARAVLIRCGTLPARFFDAADDPGGDGTPGAFESDLFFDGEDFALFEAPHVDGPHAEGAASALKLALAAALLAGHGLTDAIRDAKRYATEAVRHGRITGNRRLPAFDWAREAERP